MELMLALCSTCGHDMHMTVWTGTARAMVERKDEWNGTIIMIGQPEEIGAGSNDVKRWTLRKVSGP